MCDYKCEKIESCCNNCYNAFIEFKNKNIQKKECDHYYPVGSDGRVNKCEFCGIEKQTLSIYSYFDKEPYSLGQKSKEDNKNPFLKNTNSWYNWNRGKNEKLINKL